MTDGVRVTDSRRWMCVTCGTLTDAPILDDDTTCKCNDIYEQAWCKVPCTELERANCDTPDECKWLQKEGEK